MGKLRFPIFSNSTTTIENMFINDPDYQEHQIFEDLDKYFDFYNDFALGVSRFVSMGVTAIVNIDQQIFTAMAGTIDSIRALLRIGRINDAYALLRKYYDTAIINVYSTLYLNDNFSMENFTVDRINDWLRGTVSLPEFRVMSQYVGESARVQAITPFFYQNNYYKGLRARCNNHVHYNAYKYLLFNNNEMFLPQRMHQIEQLRVDLKNLFILHISYVFFLNPAYLSSEDIIEHLDLGLTPEPGMENEVAPYIQVIFDDVVKRYRPDVAQVIFDNTPMNLV